MSERPDSLGVAEFLESAAAHFEASTRTARASLEAIAVPSAVDVVLLASSPSAAPGADALVSVVQGRARCPFVRTGFTTLPAFVGADSLVVVAHAGPVDAPEEQRGANLAGAALDRGATVLSCGPGAAFARAGGDRARPLDDRCGEIAVEALVPLLGLVPALFVVASWAGVAVEAETELESALVALEERCSALTGTAQGGKRVFSKESVDLAKRVGRTIPLFSGAPGLGAAAARSWKRSWNLLTKAPAFVASDVGFEEVTGFGQNGDVTRQILTLVALRSELDEDIDESRSTIAAELGDEALAGSVIVDAIGGGRLAHLVDLEVRGVAAALVAASYEGIDPGPLATIAELRRRL